jgi:hypothetical protein
VNAAPVDGCGIFLFRQRIILLLTRSGGYEYFLRERGASSTTGRPQRLRLKDVVLFFFGAHGENCRSDDHSEKYQCKDKIVDHWGSLLFWRF